MSAHYAKNAQLSTESPPGSSLYQQNDHLPNSALRYWSDYANS